MGNILYGIHNCETVKKARNWLESNKVDYNFHDFRKDGMDKILVEKFLTQIKWDDLINRRGLTWRRLSEKERENINKNNAVSLIIKHPTIIKRPILFVKGNYKVGYSQKEYNDFLN